MASSLADDYLANKNSGEQINEEKNYLIRNVTIRN